MAAGAGLAAHAVGSGAAAKAPAGQAPSPRGYARWAHGLVHYYDTGSGTPLLLLHQAPMSARQFEAVLTPLAARGIRAIAVDLPGFGCSDPTPFVPAVGDWVPAIVAVMDHLGLKRSHVLGHHTGALVATEVAVQAPARVSRLILNGAFPITAEERAAGLEGVRKREIEFEYRDDGQHMQDSFLSHQRAYGPGSDARLITRYVVEKFQGFGPFWYGHHAAYQYDHAASLPRITQPTLLLSNTGDRIHPQALRARALRPDFAYAELSGGTGAIIDQQPEVWADAVADFLGTRRVAVGANTNTGEARS